MTRILILAPVLAMCGSAWSWAQSETGKHAKPRYRTIRTVHTTICDASGVVALDQNTFATVGDEQNKILIYRVGRTGPPIHSLDVSEFLRVEGDRPEVDLEAGARVGNRIYWISSHGRNRKGKKRENRYRFFASRIEQVGGGFPLVPEGMPSVRLLEDLFADYRYRRFELEKASKLAPKARNGLNIEGLTERPNGQLLIGFRNPLPFGKALIAPLLNPDHVIRGMRARFGDPILIDLKGNGIRGMATSGNAHLVIAGPFDGVGKMALYRWNGGTAGPTQISGVDLTSLNPEAVTFLPGRPSRLLLLSDDGTRKINGQVCKQLADPEQRRFRSLVIESGKN